MDNYQAPDLSLMTTDELVFQIRICGLESDDPTDHQFAKACSKELAKRKPEKNKEDI